MPCCCIAATICSDSEALTRTSFAPWPISRGLTIWSARLSGERSSRNRNPASVVCAHRHLPPQFPRQPIFWDRVQKGHEVGDADEIDRAGEFLGRERQAD